MKNKCAKYKAAFQLSLTLLSMIAISSHSAERRPTKPRVDHRISFERAAAEVAVFKTWMIGANRSGVVDAVTLPTSPIGSRYNLKGLDNKKFLQYERQGTFGGINLGWTNNASAKTAKKSAYWILVPKNQSRRVGQKDRGDAIRSTPIKYGETIALGRQPKPRNGNSQALLNAWRFLKYAKRNKGINLDWKKRPVYQWVVLGGKPGTKVRLGKDRVILYNLEHEQPLVFFNRFSSAGNVGWPDSKGKIIELSHDKYSSKKNLSPETWAAMMMKGQ